MSKNGLAAGLMAGVAGGYSLYRLLKSRKETSVPEKLTKGILKNTESQLTLTQPVKTPETLGKNSDEEKLVKENILSAVKLALGSGVALGSLSVAMATPDTTVKAGSDAKLKLGLGLLGSIWVSGAAGHFTKVKEWPALYLYVLGSLGLAGYLGKKYKAWDDEYITGKNLGKAVLFGGAAGGFLFLMDVGNTYGYYMRGGAPMKEMEEILVRQKFLYLFPVLIVAEEFLWRGILLSAFQEKGMSKHKAVALTTFLHVLNHFPVAPVGLKERAMMAAMAAPIGFLGGYLTIKTKNAWTGVIIHGMTMVSMVADLFIIPELVEKAKAGKLERTGVTKP
jgi:membrane protease YdiL (CAAX protease family)